MNKLEEFIYHLVYRNPKLKIIIRNLYQALFDMLPRKKDYFAYQYSHKDGYYFGFHDLSELSECDTKCLVQKVIVEGRMPEPGDYQSVGLLDVEPDGSIGKYHFIDKTYAWNYHKGCRLQWIGKNKIIFNTAVEGKLLSEIVDLNTNKKVYLNYPIDTVSSDGIFASTFSYERLEYCMPGYGYPYKDNDAFISEDCPRETGIFIINLITRERKLLVSLHDLVQTCPDKFKSGYMHYVTHSEFSHDSRYISFLHRWIRKEGTSLKRWTRIMVYDIVTDSLKELPSQCSGSHYVWNKKHQLLASCIINERTCHVLFDMNDLKNYKIIAQNLLNSDGHQSFIDDDTFVTDTYPDRTRMAKIYKVHIPTDTVELIASIYSPKAYQSFRTKRTGHIACDLHPRVSLSGKYLTFDSPSTGVRGVYIMKL